MKYLLDSEGYYLAIVDSPTEGVEINKPLPECPKTQKRKWNGSDWIVEDNQYEIDKKALWEANEYSRNRKETYPSIGDQLDMLMKDMKNGTTTHQEACEAVKAKYPKPE
jgi:hypothetical protein